MKELIYLIITAIIALTIIECMALSMGIDGTLLIGVVGAISGITGASFDHYAKKYKLKLKYKREWNKRG